MFFLLRAIQSAVLIKPSTVYRSLRHYVGDINVNYYHVDVQGIKACRSHVGRGDYLISCSGWALWAEAPVLELYCCIVHLEYLAGQTLLPGEAEINFHSLQRNLLLVMQSPQFWRKLMGNCFSGHLNSVGKLPVPYEFHSPSCTHSNLSIFGFLHCCNKD